jgi:hypothetical protein
LVASTVSGTAVVVAVKVNAPVAATLKVTGMGNGPLLPTTVKLALPVEVLKAVALVGVNTADTVTAVPAVAGAAKGMEVATPVASTVTGVPMLVAGLPCVNCTVPAGTVVPLAAVTVAFAVRLAPGAGVLVEKETAVLVLTGPAGAVVSLV